MWKVNSFQWIRMAERIIHIVQCAVKVKEQREDWLRGLYSFSSPLDHVQALALISSMSPLANNYFSRRMIAIRDK